MVSDEEIYRAGVLIVDDQVENVDLLKRALSRSGYVNLYSTIDAREAAPLYAEHTPDIVLLDIMMPYFDGFEVMAQIQALSKDDYAPILVLTADDQRETRIKALKCGAKDFLTKPIDRTEVLTRIRNILEVRLLHKEVLRQNAVLEDRVVERTRELHESRLEIMRRLARAAEFRDSDTGAHITRMSLYCAELGRAVGMSAQECDLLLSASALHDIGKIGIPDRVLLKPGPFDTEESNLMKEHVSIGAQILDGSDSKLIQWAAAIARTHHERWDGTGYPEGLRGEEIPLEGRIVAICDVFDALTSSRPYKEAWSVDRAIGELQRGSGAQFDAALVTLFQSILPQILEVKAQFEARECADVTADAR